MSENSARLPFHETVLGRLANESILDLANAIASKEHFPFLVDAHQQLTPLPPDELTRKLNFLATTTWGDARRDWCQHLEQLDHSPHEPYKPSSASGTDGGQESLGSLMFTCRALFSIVQEVKFTLSLSISAESKR
jgi:hypothetical protein